jgi:signal transduction histidine kinase
MPEALGHPALEGHLRLEAPFARFSSRSAFDPDALYTHLITTLRDLLNCTGAALIVPGGASGRIAAQFGPQPLPDETPLHTTAVQILAHMEQTQQPLMLSRPQPFQPPLPTPATDRSWMGIPLIVDDRLYAGISIVGEFRPGDERIAFALAQQARATLRWGLYYTEAQRQTRQIQYLLDLQRGLQQLPEQTSALDLVLDTAIEATGATHSCIFVIQNDRAASLARRGYSQDEATLVQQIPPSLQRGLHGRAYQTRTVVGAADLLRDPEALPALAGTRSQLVIPICSAERVIGLIDLQSPHPNTFGAIDDQWSQSLGTLAATAIELYQGGGAARPASGAIARPQHELLLSSRLAAVNDLASGVAHEINNPLTTILGYTHLLLRDQALPQVTHDDIGQIMIEAQRIAGLVERFLRFAQPSSAGKRPLAINEPLMEALGLLKGRLQESGIQVAIDVPADAPMVLGQTGQLEQVFLDLLQNAIESMSTADERRIGIHVGQQGEWVRVAIADTGRGIMPDLLMRIFEPGFTTKVDNGISRGLGLGLYAAHTIVQDHWGRIEVQSRIWQGSTFTVCLPAI